MIIGVAAISAITILQVFCRLFFTALTWSEELAKYIFVWVVFVGMSYGVGEAVHIKMDFFVNKLPRRAVKAAEIVSDIICVAIFLYLLQPAFDYLAFQITQKTATLGVHMGYVTAAMPVSLILCIFRFVLDILKVVKRRDDE